MENVVIIHPHQQVTSDDLNAFGELPRLAFDRLLADIGVTAKKFAGFAVSVQPPSRVVVGAGRFYAGDGRFFGNYDENGVEIDLLADLPVAAQRIVAIVAWGRTDDTATEPRQFKTNIQTGATQAEAVPTRNTRRAEIGRILGTIDSTPTRPPIPADYVVIGWATLDSSGIVSYERNSDDVIPSLGTIDLRLDNTELWQATYGALVESIQSQIAGLSDRIRSQASVDLVLDIARDVARIKEEIDLPDDFIAWAVDHFLDDEESDVENVDYLARVEEGLRFPHAAEGFSTLALANPNDPAVTISGNFATPARTEQIGLSVKGKDAELPLQNAPYQETVSFKKKSKTRKRVRFGAPFKVSTSSRWWNNGKYDPEKGIFKRDGDVFQAIVPNRLDNPGSQLKTIRLKEMWKDKSKVHYWERITTTVPGSGAVVARSWLNSQEGWLTAINLYFTRKGSTGNATLLVAECDEAGMPATDGVLETVTIANADIKVWPEATKVVVPQVLLEKGRRYCFIVQSGGAHYLAQTNSDTFSQGSDFQIGAGGTWGQLPGSNRISFELFFARYEAARVEVLLQPVTLSGGIAAIDILADVGEPDGTSIEFYILINGEWRLLTTYESNPLLGLPALVQLKMVFVGTTDMMPGIGLNNLSRVHVWRPRSDFRHISAARVMPAEVDTVYVDVRLEAWRGDEHHTADVLLLIGAGLDTEEEAESVVERPAPDDPENAILRRYTFAPASPIEEYKIQIEGTTDNVLTPFHVAERVDVGVDLA